MKAGTVEDATVIDLARLMWLRFQNVENAKASEHGGNGFLWWY